MKLIFLAFYFCWFLLTIFIISIPVPSNLSPFLHSLLSIIVLGAYLLLLSSLARVVIKSIVVVERKELVTYFAVVVILLAIFVLGRQMQLSVGAFGGTLATANLLFGATMLGSLLATAIQRVGELVPVCITAAVADAISVSKGPTKAMIVDINEYYTSGGEGAAPLVDFILVKIGIPGIENLVPVFGITDWIFVVLLSASLYRLNLKDNILPARFRAGELLFVPVAVVALYLTIILAQLTGLFIPAMVGIALLFLVFLVIKYNLYKQIRKIDLYYSVFFPSAVAVALFLYARNFA